VTQVDNTSEYPRANKHIKMEQADDGTQKMNVPADLWNYGKEALFGGQLLIETSAATYVDKGEDRHCVYYGKEMGMFLSASGLFCLVCSFNLFSRVSKLL
jgi:hypothetical protein